MQNKSSRILVILVAVTLALSGCAQMKDKFIRKPKEKKRIQRYRAVKTYDIHPSLELYTKRYVFWKNWHREILAVLRDANHKKKVVAIEQEVSNLMDMRNMLTDEKSDQLQELIDKMSEVETVIKKERITQGNETRVRKKLESLGRKIKADFSYRKMKGFIRSDFRKE